MAYLVPPSATSFRAAATRQKAYEMLERRYAGLKSGWIDGVMARFWCPVERQRTARGGGISQTPEEDVAAFLKVQPMLGPDSIWSKPTKGASRFMMALMGGDWCRR
jgi:hypothetical protein